MYIIRYKYGQNTHLTKKHDLLRQGGGYPQLDLI